MKRNEILELLRAKNKFPSVIARSSGVHRSLIYQALDGHGSRSIRVKIARFLGMPPSMIWSDVAPREQIVVDNDMYFNPKFYQDFK